MKQKTGFIVITVILLSCDPASRAEKQVKMQMPIEGTWQLISGTAITKGDTVFTDYMKNQEMIKIINSTHFAFFKHDLNRGQDSAVYDSGGGSYSLVDSQYTERLDYCTEREWEGHIFQFTVVINSDTLIQTGIEKLENLGINRLIIEKYTRVKE